MDIDIQSWIKNNRKLLYFASSLWRQGKILGFTLHLVAGKTVLASLVGAPVNLWHCILGMTYWFFWQQVIWPRMSSAKNDPCYGSSRTHSFCKIASHVLQRCAGGKSELSWWYTSRRSFNSPSEEIFILSFPRYDKKLLFPEMHFQFCDLTKKVFCLIVGVSVNWYS